MLGSKYVDTYIMVGVLGYVECISGSCPVGAQVPCCHAAMPIFVPCSLQPWTRTASTRSWIDDWRFQLFHFYFRVSPWFPSHTYYYYSTLPHICLHLVPADSRKKLAPWTMHLHGIRRWHGLMGSVTYFWSMHPHKQARQNKAYPQWPYWLMIRTYRTY